MKFKIHQIKDIANTDYAFRGYNENKFSMNDYKEVWESNEYYNVSFPGCDERPSIYYTLEEIWETFNLHRPNEFKGHSLSVSDVVEILNDGINNGLYYCDDFGWKKVG